MMAGMRLAPDDRNQCAGDVPSGIGAKPEHQRAERLRVDPLGRVHVIAELAYKRRVDGGREERIDRDALAAQLRGRNLDERA